MNAKAKKASDVLTRNEKIEIIKKITLQNLEDAPEATIEQWQESNAEKSDHEAILSVEALLIGEYVGRHSQEPQKGIKGDIIKRLEEVENKEALKLIYDFIDIANKGQISLKCNKAGDPFYSREYDLIKIYKTATKAKRQGTLYQAERLIENLERYQ